MEPYPEYRCLLPEIERGDEDQGEPEWVASSCLARVHMKIAGYTSVPESPGIPSAAADLFVSGWTIECENGHVLLMQDGAAEDLSHFDPAWLAPNATVMMTDPRTDRPITE